jgi:hypothetical protein
MPTNKDFKRLIRSRMQKTGESYTSARAQLLKQRPPQASPAPVRAAPADYARLAGMSDAAVKAKTGCTWERWVKALDYLGAVHLPHRDIAELVRKKYKVGDWWTQTVTVGYERIKGLRDIGQRRSGAYEASKSKTLAVPLARLYRAFSDERTRDRWLAGATIGVRTAARGKSMRWTWADGTLVQLYFTGKGRGKSQVAVQHTGLAGREAALRAKQYWGDRLGALARLLKAGSGATG